jgi:hypothetical protein
MDPLVDVTEQKRLNDAREAQIPWKKWGPYLSERQWGTVREDYSEGATRGITSPTTMRAHAPTSGARTGSADCAMTRNGCALRWRCGTSATRS